MCEAGKVEIHSISIYIFALVVFLTEKKHKTKMYLCVCVLEWSIIARSVY